MTAGPIAKNSDEARLARKIVAALADGPLKRETIKDRIGAGRRQRKPSTILHRMYAAGIVGTTSSRYGALLWKLDRAPLPGELDPPPPPQFDLLVDAVAVGQYEVRAVRFDDSGNLRVQIRHVRRFPSGNVLARHLLGIDPEQARELASALLDAADGAEDAE